MMATSVGLGMTAELGLATPVNLDEGNDSLDFGELEPLVRLMQDTPIDQLLPVLAKQLKNGTELNRLSAAAALANARTFGGEDYVGFHTMMALAPGAAHVIRIAGRASPATGASKFSIEIPTGFKSMAGAPAKC